MRIYGPTSTRLSQTDRNPTTVANGTHETNLASGGNTTMATYTVPVGRRAILAAKADGSVGTVFAAAQGAIIEVTVTPSGGAATQVCSRRFVAASPVGTTLDTGIMTIQLKAGDQVQSIAEVDAGAGVLTGAGGIQGVEFDA